MWAVKMFSNYFRVTYIGETGTSFYKRTKEHVIQTLGGNYQICDPDAMQRGESIVVWNGLWRKGYRDKFPEFLRRYEGIATVIKGALSVQNIFVAPMDVDSRTRKRIEGALAFAVRNNKDASSLLPKDIRYFKNKEDESPIAISIEAQSKIEGLPRQIICV